MNAFAETLHLASNQQRGTLRRYSTRRRRKPGDAAAQTKKGGIFGIFKILGPGLITGAADDDPSGIATYSQTGAQFGFGLLWTALYQIPLLLAQDVTSKGVRPALFRRLGPLSTDPPLS